MGDSPGGGMALAIPQRLRDTGGRPPDRLVLIAPWLDITLGNPAVAASSPRSNCSRRSPGGSPGRSGQTISTLPTHWSAQ
ncbi:alpha/beta hydrolase fold domain-containing protein [Streptomyces decoyicus]